MTPWTPSHAYVPGDRVNVHIPPTWWDRVRMFFGFKRKSPATEAYECGGVWLAGDGVRWRVTRNETRPDGWEIEMEEE